MAPNLVHSPRDGTVSATQNRPGRLREFDEVTLPAGQRVEARRVRIGDIPLLLGQGEAGMGVALAPAITVARIARADPDSLWGFWRHGRFVGGFAFLMLNRHGVEALIGDALDLGDPPMSVLPLPATGQRESMSGPCCGRRRLPQWASPASSSGSSNFPMSGRTSSRCRPRPMA